MDYPEHLTDPPQANWRIHDLIFQRHLLHEHITSNYHQVDFEQLQPLIALRDDCEDLAWNQQEPLTADDGGDTFVVPDLALNDQFLLEEQRCGVSNDLLKPDARRDLIRAAVEPISYQWLMSLTSAQAHALLRYTGSSKDYALASQDDTLPELWQHFESAVEHAPQTPPFVVYTGVNVHYVGMLLDQAASGMVTFDRVFSASLNPAQVNGFATDIYTENGCFIKTPTLALEVLSRHGAFMDVISRVPHELEVLLAKGEYEVIRTLKNVRYQWDSEPDSPGRTIDYTLQLRQL